MKNTFAGRTASILVAAGVLALAALAADAGLITMVNSQSSVTAGTWAQTNSGTAYWWSDHLAPAAGNDYVVGAGMALRTVSSTSPTQFTFAGTSLQLDTGGSLLLKVGANTVTISDLRLNGGSIQTYQDGTTTIAGAVSLLTDSTSNVNTASNRSVTISAPISGDGNLSKDGPANLTLSGANTYTGKTIVNGGALLISNEDRLGAAPAAFVADQITLNGGILRITANATIDDANRGITLGPLGGTFNHNAYTLNIANVITGAGSLSKTGNGGVILTGANTYTGRTIITGGTIRVDSEERLGATPAELVADQITLNGGNLIFTANYALAPSNRGITLGASGGMLGADAGLTLTVTKDLVGSGNLTKGGSGTMVMAIDPSFTGRTIVTTGTLRIDGERRLGAEPAAFTASQLALNGGTLATTTTFAIDDPNRGITVTGTSSTINVAASTTLTINNPIAGAGKITKTGGGTLVLPVANAGWTGGMDIVATGAGVVRATADDALGLGAIKVAGYGLSVDLVGGITLHNNFITSGNGGPSGGDADGAIHSVSGDNTIVGNLSLMSGGGGSTWQVDANSLTLNGNVSAVDSGRTLTLRGAGDGTITGVIANGSTSNLPVTKTGAGTWTLSGASTYTGATTVSQGTLKLGATGSLASRTIVVASGARFDVADVATFALASGQTIKGSGQVLGALTVGSGSILAPGLSPGTLPQTGVQTWAGGGQYTWEVSQVTAGGGDQAALQGTDPGFDFVDITGALAVTATAVDKFIIAITGLTLANVSGAVTNWDPQADYAWVIATASDGITGFNAGAFTLDVSAFEASNVIPVGRKFAIAQEGNNLLLTYVPEPATLALLAFGAVATLLSRKRQRK